MIIDDRPALLWTTRTAWARTAIHRRATKQRPINRASRIHPALFGSPEINFRAGMIRADLIYMNLTYAGMIRASLTGE